MNWQLWTAIAILASEALVWVYRIGRPRPTYGVSVGILGLAEWGFVISLIVWGAHA